MSGVEQNEKAYTEQAQAIATLADSIATGRLVGPRHAAVARLVDMVDTLRAWTPDDRSHPSTSLAQWEDGCHCSVDVLNAAGCVCGMGTTAAQEVPPTTR